MTSATSVKDQLVEIHIYDETTPYSKVVLAFDKETVPLKRGAKVTLTVVDVIREVHE